MMRLSVILIMLCGQALASTNSVPPLPPDSTTNTTNTTNFTGQTFEAKPVVPDYKPTADMQLSASVEWELTIEWADNLAGTNAVAYPIRIQVPFEHDGGFVFIRARKVKAAK